MKQALMVCGILLMVSSCAGNNFTQPIRTESLVSSSSEKVSFPITDASSIKIIENWINEGENKPSSAEIACAEKNKSCLVVKSLLKRKNISFKEVAITSDDKKAGNISIIYNKILARDCETSDFGCSTSINSLRMVTNREQFTKPAISDYQDAAGAVNAVNSYLK